MNIRRDCIHYHCEHEMGASIDCCSLKGLGKCPCSEDCAEYANRAEVYKMGLEAIKSKHTKHMIDERSTIEPEPHWIPCSERMPECEQEVLICTMKKVYVSRKSGMEWYEEPIITPALYEDGTVLEVNSKWRWEDIDYAGWDEEEDCGIIPEGWWKNRHFNQDDVYNNVVDKKVIAWMPLPEPYREGEG